jgi:hypothetical protein
MFADHDDLDHFKPHNWHVHCDGIWKGHTNRAKVMLEALRHRFSVTLDESEDGDNS